MKIIEQIGFSSVLFDTLFGLILFFCLDSFLDIRGFTPFVFYIFSVIILVHWWLIFKSADDAFGEEVSDSALDLLFGVVYVIFIEYIILDAKAFDMAGATLFLLALLFLDLAWALAWRYIGQWESKDKKKIASMEKELSNNIWVDLMIIPLFVFLFLLAPYLPDIAYLIIFIVLYLLFVISTFRHRIIDLKIF
ncbi:MAG: hypothetical protein PHG95_03465 [Patescibacteria group bacterium]|nr:hypothetical protein [Patescibacteria group bacterium]